jgi:hypothetical protein
MLLRSPVYQRVVHWTLQQHSNHGSIACRRSLSCRLLRSPQDLCRLRRPFSTEGVYRPDPDDDDGRLVVGNMDDLCRKHMDLPAQEFAMGCSFLHQVALGLPTQQLEEILKDRPSLINFRKYFPCTFKFLPR